MINTFFSSLLVASSLLVMGCGQIGSASTSNERLSLSQSPDLDSSVRESICLQSNVQRRSMGLQELHLDPAMSSVAQSYAYRMATENFFSHVSPDGQTFTVRLTSGGVQYNYAGENIAQGYTSSDTVMIGWMHSPGHRANILNSKFGRLGVGHSGNYWVQVFAN